MEEYRAELGLGEGVYFDHAVRGPLPRAAMDALAAAVIDPTTATTERLLQADATRALLSALIGAQPHEIAFVAHTAEAVCLALEGLRFNPGDNVVGIADDFPSVSYPLIHLQRSGVEHRAVPMVDGQADAATVIAQIDERTRAVALSWVLHASGCRLDLRAIGSACRTRGALFIVDVAQGLGALALDVERERIDVCAGTAHKWLLGAEGLGILYVSDRVVERLEPRRLARFSVERRSDPGRLQWSPGARRYETGTLNTPAIVALSRSLAMFERAGSNAIERRLLALCNRLGRGLVELGFEIVGALPARSGIVAAVHAEIEAEDIRQRLRAKRVFVSQRQGRLRVSPHFYNTDAEVERFLETIAAAVGE